MSQDIAAKTNYQTATRTDIYQSITDAIIADLERGELTWRKPWSSDHLAGSISRPKRATGEFYMGINVITLWSAAAARGYQSSTWLTFAQAQKMKAHVKKGEKGSTVVYADKTSKFEEDGDGNAVEKRIPFLKAYTVFNASQIEGLPAEYYEQSQALVNPESRDETLDLMFKRTGADISTGTQASYNIATDRIQMPPFEAFHSKRDFYSTLSHELCHWTRHPTRLDRDMGRTRYGDEGYAKEELVAELGACFLAADLGLEPKPAKEHAAYIQSWLRVLKDDKRFIVSAASHAQKAVEYFWKLQAV